MRSLLCALSLAAAASVFVPNVSAQTASADCAYIEAIYDRSGKPVPWTRGQCCGVGNTVYEVCPSFRCAEGRVVEVFICSQGLTGPLPTFESFKTVEVLSLWENQFTGTIPDYAALGMTKLQRAYLDANQITGEIPNLRGLPDLATFWISANDVSGNVDGKLPATLTECQLTLGQTNPRLYSCVGDIPPACTAPFNGQAQTTIPRLTPCPAPGPAPVPSPASVSAPAPVGVSSAGALTASSAAAPAASSPAPAATASSGAVSSPSAPAASGTASRSPSASSAAPASATSSAAPSSANSTAAAARSGDTAAVGRGGALGLFAVALAAVFGSLAL